MYERMKNVNGLIQTHSNQPEPIEQRDVDMLYKNKPQIQGWLDHMLEEYEKHKYD